MRYLTLFALALLVGITAAACNTGTSTPPSMVVPTIAKYTTMPSDGDMLAEKVIGNPNAPTTIYEYVSLWCSGCATFHATVEPQIRSQFVDTGQAKIVFRNLFLTSELAPATSNPNGYPIAPMLARCVGNADFFSAIDYIYITQPRWTSNSDPNAGVKSAMLAFGMAQSLEDSCLADGTLANGLGQIHNNALAQSYQLPDGTTEAGFNQVPAIVVSGPGTSGANVKLDVSSDPNRAPTVANIAKYVK